MKRILLALALTILATGASAQCNGVFAKNTVCGNATGSSNLPKPTSPSAFIGAAGGTNGQIQYNNAGALGGFTASGDATVNTSTGVVTIQPDAVTTGKILNGAVTKDKLAGNALPVIPTRTAIASLDLTAYTGIIVQGFASPGDGGGMVMTKVASQPFCGAYTNTAATQDSAGNWWNIAEPYEYRVMQFGAKFDWNGVDGTATDDTTAVQSALWCAGIQNSAGNDVGGGQGRRLLLPRGSSMISTTITVPNQVWVLGTGQYSTVLKMKGTFSNGSDFIKLGTQYSQTDITALQSRGSAGNLTINGSMVRSGVGYFLQPTVPAIFAAANNSGVTFTITGTDRYGAALVQSFAGPTAGSFSEPSTGDTYFSTITQISTNAATVGTVSVGSRQIASFGSRLEELQLFSDIILATSGTSMVYTNSVQHTGGIKGVKIFAGNRTAARFVVGYGGASYFIFEDVEGFNQGNCGSCASNNPVYVFDYAGLQTPLRNVLAQGPGVSGGAAQVGIHIASGFVYLSNFHCEAIATCVNIETPSANNGYTILQNGIGGSSMTDFIKIQAAVDANTVTVQGMYPNGATNAIDNRGVAVTGNVFAWTTY